MSTPEELADKVFKANKNDRAANTKQVLSKLEELKPSEKALKSQDAMSAFFESMKGDPGIDGKTPEKGVDYLTEEEVTQIKQELTPVKGVHYNDGQDGKDGELGQAGANGVDGKDGSDGLPGEKGESGENGKDGSPDSAEQIVEKLQTIKQAWIELSQIKGLQQLLEESGNSFLQQAKGFVPRSLDSLYDVAVRGVIADGQSLIWNAAKQKWIPGTGAGSGSLAIETPSGTLNGSNTIFTVSNTPVFITLNGQVLTGSGVDYTYSAGTITLVNAPFSTDILRSYHN